MKQLIERHTLSLTFVILLLFSIGLVVFRVKYTNKLFFAFLLWNLFLAILPLAFIKLRYISKNKLWIFCCFTLSLLFLPNAPYIVTDLFHIRPRGEMPIWFDTLMIFSSALSGLILFYATLFEMERILPQRWGFPGILSIVFLSAFGIYLGRYLRFNSWDLMSDPTDLLTEILTIFSNPFAYPGTWGMTLSYGGLLLIGYLILKSIMKGKRSDKQLSTST